MSITDWDINVAVRRVLVKHGVDVRQVLFNSIGGIVYLKGVFSFFLGGIIDHMEPESIRKQHEMEALQMKRIELEIKKIREVKGIKFNISNWTKAGQIWRKRT